ncbi:MAG: N-acetylmuramoyl-L-alanine amidase [Desulfotomaculales bacterium]
MTLARNAIFLFFLLICGILLSFGISRSAGAAEVAIVHGDVVNLRSGPGTNYQVTGQVTRGTRLEVLGKSGNWYKIAYARGKTSWIAGWLVKVENIEVYKPPAQSPSVPANPPVGRQVAVVQGDVVNLRSGPGTNYQITAKTTRGAELEVLGKSGDWYKIAYAGGKTSWIAGWLVKVKTVPAPVAPPQRGGGRPVFELTTEIGEGKIVLQIRTPVPVSYQIFTLGNPDRLVIDLAGLPDGDLPPGGAVSSPLITAIRTGWFQRDPMVARVACDLGTNRHAVRYQDTLKDDGRTIEIQLLAVDATCRNGKIVLDPGHGGSDPGAIGRAGIREKDVNLAVALECARLLREQGFEVVLTRDADYDLDLYKRTEIANGEEAAVFVSIHSNSNPDASKQGVSTYYYAPADDPVLGPQAEQRRQLAQCIQDALVAATGRPDLGLYQAKFAVLRTSEMPSALVEIAFLSNVEEENLLSQEWFQKQAANAIAGGIVSYLGWLN